MKDSLRKCAAVFARTPLHPQWLLETREVPVGLRSFSGSVLDIGAADRWIEPRLQAGTDYVALDYPATGRDFYGARPHIFADGARLPIISASFDGVICLEVLEHVADPSIVVAEIARVLKRGGRAWLSMPFLYPLHDAPFDFQRYTEYGLRRDAQRAGLEIVTLRKSGHAIRSAGLLMSLAIAGGVHARGGWVGLLLLPLVAVFVLVINLVAYLLSWVWPDWNALAMGHEVEVRKP